MKKLFLVPFTIMSSLIVITAALAATSFFQGFESDTDGWFDFGGGTTVRVASGTGGIASSSGGYHAVIDGPVYTDYGGYESVFPSGGYTASIDIYLDMAEADGTDKRFAFSSAINNPAGTHRRDFVFSVGTDPNTAGQWAVSASNNAPGWPLDPNRDPITIDETGWYTFRHTFQDDGAGVLEATMEVLDASGSVLGTWTLSDATDIIGGTVGGHRYGWFTSQRFDFASLAIDNSSLVSINEPADKDDCKSGGWESLTRADGSSFTNQGDCIQYVNTGK